MLFILFLKAFVFLIFSSRWLWLTGGWTPDLSSEFKAGPANSIFIGNQTESCCGCSPSHMATTANRNHHLPNCYMLYAICYMLYAIYAICYMLIWPPLLTGIIICQIGLDWGERTEPGYAPNILFPFFSRLIRPSLKLIKEVQTKLLNPSEKLSFPEKVFCGHVY